MVEQKYNPFRLGNALFAVSPKMEMSMNFTSYENSLLWKRRPYAHEFALVRASFGLLERQGKIDRAYTQNMAFILKWISQLKDTDFKMRRDRAFPLFLDERSKELIEQQIINLQRVDSSDSPETSIALSIFLAGCIGELAEFNIIDNGQAPPGPSEPNLVY